MSIEASKTPETDAEARNRGHYCLPDMVVPKGVASRLEIERDEAQRELQVVLGSKSLRIAAEIAKARNTEIEQLTTERDALRAELQEWKGRVEALANELHGGVA